jgi:hypothetical protein
MSDKISLKSRHKKRNIQHDVLSGLFGFQIDSSSKLEAGSSESVIFQLSQVYSNRIVV